MESIFNMLLKTLRSLLLPYTCVLCKAKSQQDRDLCINCERELPYLKHHCDICAEPLSSIRQKQCAHCLKQQPYFDETFALFEYRTPVDKLITQLKFNQRLLHARILGGLMAEKVQTQAELIIPVPLHKKRLRERGFNQALELAKPLAKILRLPLSYRHCQRARHTQAQSSLALTDKKRNLREAFSIHAPIPSKVMIVDDVMTSGNTVNELSRTLRQAGAEHIQICCVARTGR